MPSEVVIIKKRNIPQKSAVVLTWRQRDENTGNAILPAYLTGNVHMEVWDITTPAVPVKIGEEDIDPDDLVLSSLNTGYLATDDVGFNCRYDLDGQTYLPQGEKTYRIEFKFVPAIGFVYYPPIFELTTIKVYSETPPPTP